MSTPINLLILSCGTRNKLISYFKQELGGNGSVIATDCSPFAPALYDADKYYIVPPFGSEEYIDVILKICTDNQVNAVLSLIDPELSILDQYRAKFEEIGVLPIISNSDTLDLSFNKFLFQQSLKNNGFPSIKSYVDKTNFKTDLEKGLISFPVFVKPVQGSASIDINKVNSMEGIDLIFAQHENMMIQEYIQGVEYGIDVFMDLMSDQPIEIFIKEKIRMRAGETDKSRSVKDPEIRATIERFLSIYNYKGIIDIDAFMWNGKCYISEVNPRFGGGYPHAHECGMNVPRMIINNLRGIENQPDIGNYEENIVMMKYNDVKIIKLEKD